MTRARREQVSLETTPYYHCVCRCVRRAFLCGNDPFSGKNYDHRKQWIVDRLKQLTEVFAMEIAAYAVMSNHYHVLVRIDAARAQGWSLDEVIERWYQLFSGHSLADRYRAGEPFSPAERTALNELVQLWRERLGDLGWFMRCLNEPLARRANAEDDCRGRFWEGRYKSQALLDEAAVVACMAYIDLNPIRARLAETPETSAFTSICERIHAQKRGPSSEQLVTPSGLLPFSGAEQPDDDPGLPFDWLDYLALVDWTGRAIRADKRGAIPGHLAPILQRLGVNDAAWVDHVQHFGRRYFRAVGAAARMQAFAAALGQKWTCGISNCLQIYRASPA